MSEPLANMRAALDDQRASAAIGAAKDLVEASCKLIVKRAGVDVGNKPQLPTLFKRAHECVAGEDESAAGDLGKSLAATAQRLGELRNTAGAGHGHAKLPSFAIRDARLAAVASTGLSAYLLGAWT